MRIPSHSTWSNMELYLPHPIGVAVKDHHYTDFADIATYECVRQHYIVTVSEEDIAEANKYAAITSTNEKKASERDKGSDAFAMVNGKIGEMALGGLYGLYVDVSYLVGGDAGDFVIHGKTVDVKWCKRINGQWCIPFTRNDGTLAPIKCDYYIFVRQHEKNSIEVCGWMPREALYTCRGVRRCPQYGMYPDRTLAKFQNLEIGIDELLPMVNIEAVFSLVPWRKQKEN